MLLPPTKLCSYKLDTRLNMPGLPSKSPRKTVSVVSLRSNSLLSAPSPFSNCSVCTELDAIGSNLLEGNRTSPAKSSVFMLSSSHTSSTSSFASFPSEQSRTNFSPSSPHVGSRLCLITLVFPIFSPPHLTTTYGSAFPMKSITGILAADIMRTSTGGWCDDVRARAFLAAAGGGGGCSPGRPMKSTTSAPVSSPCSCIACENSPSANARSIRPDIGRCAKPRSSGFELSCTSTKSCICGSYTFSCRWTLSSSKYASTTCLMTAVSITCFSVPADTRTETSAGFATDVTRNTCTKRSISNRSDAAVSVRVGVGDGSVSAAAAGAEAGLAVGLVAVGAGGGAAVATAGVGAGVGAETGARAGSGSGV